MRTFRSAAVVGVAALSLCACTGTSSTTDDYQHKVANSAQALSSTVNVALLDAQMVRDDKILAPDLKVSLEQAYSDASNTVAGFDAVVPPHAADVRYQQRLDAVASDAVATLQAMRVANSQGREARLPDHIPNLKQIAARLAQLESIA